MIARSNIKIIALIVILTSLVYANSLSNSFVLDDFLVIVYNDFIKSSDNFLSIFSRDYLSPPSEIKYLGARNIGSGESTYRPVVTATYFLDFFLWKLNPFGYHLTNLFLHILNALLLYFLVCLISKDKRIALVGALLFALHPVNAEAVNVISFREDLLVFLFFISSFILFIRQRFYIASLGLFLLALLSKEAAVTLPFLLVLYGHCFRSRCMEFQNSMQLGELEGVQAPPQGVTGSNCDEKEQLRPPEGRSPYGTSSERSKVTCYLGYFAVLLFYFLAHFFILKDFGAVLKWYPGGSFYTNLLTMSRVFATYIKWLFFPIGIHATLPENNPLISYSLMDPWVLPSIALLASCFFIAIIMRKRSKEISFGVLWFFIALLPVSNILPITNYIASRYLYIPVVGFCLLVPTILFRSSRLRHARRVIIVTLLVFFSMFTMIRNIAWKNDTVLWLEMVENYPQNALAHSNLGLCYRRTGFIDKAIYEYRLALNLDPYFTSDYIALGESYYVKGMLEESIVQFKKAVELDPSFLDTYSYLGLALMRKGLYEEAEHCFRQAIELNPRSTETYNNLGVLYASMNRTEEAKRAWNMALEIDPQYKEARNNLKKIEYMTP